LVLVAVVLVGMSTIAGISAIADYSGAEPGVVQEVDYASVYSDASPSVVSVYARNTTDAASSQGSGFVYDDAGRVVTNWHVIAGGDSTRVRYKEGEWTNATVVGVDPYTDLAVLEVKSRPGYADPLSVANAPVPVGSNVMAIGSPNNLRGSLTEGVVSGLNRSMRTAQGFVIPDLIQTEASLNPGNSGGPLVRMDGTVVGVNRARQGENIGYAVSGILVNTIVPTLIENGEYRHSLVGIRGKSLDPAEAQANNITLQQGILVTGIVEGGPAEGSLQSGGGESIRYNGRQVYNGGDVLVKINDQPIATNEELTSYLMKRTTPGDETRFTVVRDGERVTVSFELGERPSYSR
jgi:S1-C subfamily serine protease